MMIFQQIPTGGDRNFAYLIAEKRGGEAAVIDPSFNINRIIKVIQDYQLIVKYIINTHGHYDHLDGNSALKAKTGAKIVMHSSAQGDPNYDIDADFNGDGSIDTLDLDIYRGFHRQPPGPSCCGA